MAVVLAFLPLSLSVQGSERSSSRPKTQADARLQHLAVPRMLLGEQPQGSRLWRGEGCGLYLPPLAFPRGPASKGHLSPQIPMCLWPLEVWFSAHIGWTFRPWAVPGRAGSAIFLLPSSGLPGDSLPGTRAADPAFPKLRP